MSYQSGEIDWTDEAEEREPGEDRRCTPETLLAFIREEQARSGRMPTLEDCKLKFGGILSVLVHGWELQRRGML